MIGGLAELTRFAKRRYVEVAIDGSDVMFRLQSLTERERSSYEAAMIRNGKIVEPETQKARLLCLCLVDEVGNRLLGDADFGQLMGLDAAVAGKLFDEAIKLIGLADSNSEAAVKN